MSIKFYKYFVRVSMSIIVFTSALLILFPGNVKADPGDTTWVTTFNQEFQNWATVHKDTFQLPDTNTRYQKILMFYTIGCPAAGCDPWDRLGWIKIYKANDTINYEIARIVTPYNIVGAGYPGTCTWVIDVSDYDPLLHYDVIMGSYIESWIGGNRGWLVTAKLAYIEGEPDFIPYKIVNLWQYSRIVYGDPSNPVEAKLLPKNVTIDPSVDKVKIRIVTTGHGQGNTDNAAEFSYKWHSILVGADSVSHYLWRDDCPLNPCSPQGGTWAYPRAGWCPGQSVIPWDNDITSSVTPGQSVMIDYNVQPYENFCRPNNPGCTTGVTCPDCNYNYTGHTEPHYTVQSHLVYYYDNPLIKLIPISTEVPGEYNLNQNYPNPFNPNTTIEFGIPEQSNVKLYVFDLSGRIVKRLVEGSLSAGSYSVEFRGGEFASGVYLCKLFAGDIALVKKMVLMK